MERSYQIVYLSPKVTLMDREIEDSERDKKIDELFEKQIRLDNICHEIFLTLMAYKKLRFNELHRSLGKLGISISKPTLTDHLRHLTRQKLVKRKREDQQNVSYGLTEEIKSLLHVSEEDLREWLEVLENDETIPDKFRPIKFDVKEYYKKLPETELDKETDCDLNDTLALNLHELRNLIQYDLRIDKGESDADFWHFVGNPLYRMHERSIAEKCRDSGEYRKKLFDKMDMLINELRSDKELLKKRNMKSHEK